MRMGFDQYGAIVMGVAGAVLIWRGRKPGFTRWLLFRPSWREQELARFEQLKKELQRQPRTLANGGKVSEVPNEERDDPDLD